MRERTHPWGTILHEVRESDSAGRSGDLFSDDRSRHWVYGNSWGGYRNLWRAGRHGGRGACPGSGRVRWARAAQHPPAGGPLDDQRDSPAGGCRLDDDLWQDVYSVYARPNGVAIGKQMGLGLSFLGRPLSAGHFSRTLRCAAPGSGVGTVRARALGTVPGASSGFPGADPFPFGTALGIYTLWVLLPEASASEYDRLAQNGGHVNSAAASSH